MKTLQFSNGDKIPLLGLGTWQSEPSQVFDAVSAAIRDGYKMIDCARIYENEDVIGDALQSAFESQAARRDDIFITSKLWNDSHAPEDVLPAIKNTLKNLNLDYLDLYLIHWPIAFKNGVVFPKKPEDFLSLEQVPLQETWAAMEELKSLGLARHIGVSNFGIAKLEKLLASAKLRPEMNQIEIHPYFQQGELVDFCQKNKILATAYSPLGTADAIGEIAKESAVVEVSKKHNCTPAQTILAWNIHRNVVVIPKSVNPKRIAENFGALKVKLDEDDMKKLAGVDKNKRILVPDVFEMKGAPYTVENIF